MRLAYVQWHWAVLQTFGAWGRVIAETPLKEPVIDVDDDRLVLRRVDRRFWTAAACPSCAATLARVDLANHEQSCARLRSSTVHVLPVPSGRTAALAPPPSRAAVGAPVVVPAPHRQRDPFLNPSSARVFGQKPVLTGGLLIGVVAALAAALVIAAVLASA